jgi:hypothetical protein
MKYELDLTEAIRDRMSDLDRRQTKDPKSEA